MAARRRPVEAFRTWWSRRSLNERRLMTALALILLVMTVALARAAALTALFLAPLAAIIGLALLRPTAREWWIENALPLGALLLSGWLLGALLLWGVVNVVWAGQAQRPNAAHSALTVAGVPLTAGAAYPAVALVDATGDELALSFSAGAVPLPRQYVTATVTLPDTLAFATAGGPATRDFRVPLTADQPGSRRIGIVNSGAYGGWRGREATISVRLCAGQGNCGDDLALTVRPEGRSGYVLRRFVNSTVDRSSPIILLLLFAVPGLALWAQRVLDGRRAALRRQRAKDCERFITHFRSHLRARQIGRAAADLAELNQPRYLEFSLLEREFATELYRLARLDYELPEDLANPRWPEWPDAKLLSMVDQNPGWSSELVTAGTMAYRRLNDPALAKHYRELGSGYDFELTLAKRLQEFHDDVWPAVMQAAPAATERLKSESANTDKERFDALIGRRPVLAKMGLAPYTTNSRRLSTPFALGDARQAEEVRFLRDGQAFWVNHPLLRQLRRGDHSVVVSGAEGSGRAALAHSLPLKYTNHPADLFVRIDSQAERPQMVRRVAAQLLRFVRHQPLFLGHCGPRQTQTLAAFLTTWLDGDQLHTGIQRTLDQLQRDKTLRENNLAAERLTNFRANLPAPSDPPALHKEDWFHVFLEPVHILEFANVVFVVNLGRSHQPWLDELGDFNALCERDIHFWLFVDEIVRDDVAIVLHDTPRAVVDLRLAWLDKPYFRAMLEWRYEKYLDAINWLPQRDRPPALVNCFDDEEAGLARMIAAAQVNGEYNPSRFMARWRDAVGEKEVDQTITTADVDRALANGGRP